MTDAAPIAINGRKPAGGIACDVSRIPPKTSAMIKGASSAIFASGARVSDRMLAKATAAADSETHGILRSSSVGLFDFETEVAVALGAFRSPVLNCPV